MVALVSGPLSGHLAVVLVAGPLRRLARRWPTRHFPKPCGTLVGRGTMKYRRARRLCDDARAPGGALRHRPSATNWISPSHARVFAAPNFVGGHEPGNPWAGRRWGTQW